MIDIKQMDMRELPALADTLRGRIIEVTARNGGHLSSNLGAVELTIALHRALDLPRDSIVFDVGHQSYAHKLLTGRDFDSLRMEGGVSGFPVMAESPFDAFGTGHAGTALSAALGIARANRLMGSSARAVAVVGDGALTCGQCFEALNDAGSRGDNLLLVINDNGMSISKNVGAVAKAMSRFRRQKGYLSVKGAIKTAVRRIPGGGDALYRGMGNLKKALKQLISPCEFFEALGFNYVGPVDGHDFYDLASALEFAKTLDCPVALHIITQKGNGYAPAVCDPGGTHGVKPPYSQGSGGDECVAAGEALCALAAMDERVCAITAAMTDGTGLNAFAQTYPERFFDVGIAEAHAVTMACGLAAGGQRPFVCVYSTFLQRSYDQILHDAALQGLNVCFLVYKAGFAGPDGATHHGLYDTAFLGHIPGLTVMAPRDLSQLEQMINAAGDIPGPVAIRVTKGLSRKIDAVSPMPRDRWETVCDGRDAVIVATGSMVGVAVGAAEELISHGISARVIDARRISPIDEQTALGFCDMPLLVMEEGAVRGGLGETLLAQRAALPGHMPSAVLGAEAVMYAHATRDSQLKSARLTAQDAAARVMGLIEACKRP